MATAAQINANRANAKSSTGPKSPEGKETSARNATRFGLFATNNCVHPHEQEEYDHFCSALWEDLAPTGPVQEVTAAEFVRNAWRLRRCATAEERLGAWAGRIQRDDNKRSGIDRTTADPLIHDDTRPVQISVDRARAQAQNGMRRAKLDLEKLQSEPHHHPAAQPTVPETAAATAIDPQQNEPNSTETPDAIQTQSAPGAPRRTVPLPRNPRNQPCPCGSGIKFKRCCALAAPPLLQKAA